MKKRILNFVKYLALLSIGLIIFGYKYDDFDFRRFFILLKNIHWHWIYLSFVLSMLSHLSRALRWNMLINPIGYHPKWYHTFFAVMVMYATNLIIPRGGEVARCTVLAKNNKIPFSKLIGTVVTERAIDMLILFILVIITLIFQIGIFKEFLIQNPESAQKIHFLLSPWFLILLAISLLLLTTITWKYRKKLVQIKIFRKLTTAFENLIEGIKSINKLKNPGIFIAHSLFIYIMYFLMLYVVFFSFDPTKNLSLITGLTTFIMGGLAMLAPVQGGIGAWHFMVIETLKLYHLNEIHAADFAFLAHTTTNLFLLVAGGISFLLLPLFKSN